MGRADVAHLLTLIGEVIDGLEPGAEFRGRDQTVTLVRATVGTLPLDGALIQTADAEDRLAELTLLLRPLAGIAAAVERMAEKLRARPLPSSRN